MSILNMGDLGMGDLAFLAGDTFIGTGTVADYKGHHGLYEDADGTFFIFDPEGPVGMLRDIKAGTKIRVTGTLTDVPGLNQPGTDGYVAVSSYSITGYEGGSAPPVPAPVARKAAVDAATAAGTPWYEDLGSAIGTVARSISPQQGTPAALMQRQQSSKLPSWVAPVAIVGTLLVIVSAIGRRRRVLSNPDRRIFGKRSRRRRGRYLLG